MTLPLLSARGVAHAFGACRVLEDVALELHPGETLVVVGPNGAGKTTLLRVLSGVLRPGHGTVALGGRDLRLLSPRAIARELAVVPQELAAPFPYSVREMVAMGRAPHLGPLGRELAADRSAIQRALTALGLIPLSERPFPILSGGEKQRVLLARALAQGADALLLDEPTSHMDLGHRLHTFEWLGTWLARRRERRGVLIVTHDLALGARFADRMIVLDAGRIVGCGPPAEVLTPELIEAVYDVEARVEHDAQGRPIVVAARSRIRYIADADERDPGHPRA